MKELVHVDGRNVTYSRGVAHFAAALSPLGLVSSVVAEVAACVTELRQLEIEERRIEATRRLTMEMISQRRHEVAYALGELRLQTVDITATTGTLRQALSDAMRMMTNPAFSEDERLLAQTTVTLLSGTLASVHESAGERLRAIIDTVLNGGGGFRPFALER